LDAFVWLSFVFVTIALICFERYSSSLPLTYDAKVVTAEALEQLPPVTSKSNDPELLQACIKSDDRHFELFRHVCQIQPSEVRYPDSPYVAIFGH